MIKLAYKCIWFGFGTKSNIPTCKNTKYIGRKVRTTGDKNKFVFKYNYSKLKTTPPQ